MPSAAACAIAESGSLALRHGPGRPRLASLRRQATRTRNFEQISADLRELLRVWYGYKWEQAKAERRAAGHAAESATAGWTTARDALLAQQNRIDEVQRRLLDAQVPHAPLRRPDQLHREPALAIHGRPTKRDRRLLDRLWE